MATMTITDAAMMSVENRCFMLASTLMVERSSQWGEAADGLGCIIINLFDREVYEVAHIRREVFMAQRLAG
jgi:hypothetical protein